MRGLGTSHNLGLIPPLMGKNLAFAPDTVLRMFDRSLIALRKRVRLRSEDLAEAPAFFDFIYSLVADFEGHEEVAQDGRYYILPQRWLSSFGEMYSSLAGRFVEDLIAVADGSTILRLSGGISCRFSGASVEFGSGVSPTSSFIPSPVCLKNFEGEPCTLDFIKTTILNLSVTSAADFGDYIEFGLDGRFNLGMHGRGFHLVSTENPPSDHRL